MVAAVAEAPDGCSGCVSVDTNSTPNTLKSTLPKKKSNRPGDKETLPAKFLLNSFLSKLAPLTNYITDLVSSFNSASESGM